ncbi:TetR/AcrR family transcriptional regulator [Pseudaeromonas sp. ZJS20]|uniref:TetR/AcrR family transcriptional regulator n=1 Tax=Pseudaeromonas aegiceratis TaxID=3153928 RepID=UPI00390CD91A
MQAATYILTEAGWAGLTTNAIAARAGVNIGSLYQFFPNKEAVIAELQRRHAVAIHEELRQTLAGLPEHPSLTEVLTVLVEMLIIEHRAAPALHKAITEELPSTLRWLPEEKQALQRQVLASLQPFMGNVPDPELAIFLMSVAAEGAIHKVTAQRPELLHSPQLVAELVTLFEPYLCRPAGR